MSLLLSFADVVDSVRLEAARLKDEGVEMLIALGHYGYAEDMAMAQQGWANLLLVIGVIALVGVSCVNLAALMTGNPRVMLLLATYVSDQKRALYINLLSRSNSVNQLSMRSK